MSVTGIGGKGSLAAGFLIVVFMYTGWDGSIYVNEEAKHRSTNPGRAAILTVVFLAIIYTMSEVGLQGVVSPARLQANSDSALVYVARAIGSGGWEKVMALALALSVIASTGTGIVVISRMVYRMVSRRVLPEVLSRISPRFSTPAVASIVISLIVIAVMWVYLLSSSVANVFTDLIDVTSLLYIGFYILTAVAAMAYYRSRVFSNVWVGLIVGILPILACVFLGWILVKSLVAAPASQLWSIAGIIVVGLVLMLSARFVMRSPFFEVQRESATPGPARS